jgi:parallel beta-helix repeat protein
MDIINSDLGFLGRDAPNTTDTAIIKDGGVYGVSWRIPNDTYGKDIATGWVENSSFHDNYIGAYTFGASGMMWRGNHFYHNDKYGLDPHDDSNNALIENNLFEDNGTHGFIMSKRCNFNIIRNNISRNNKLHGFMLHESSNFNIIENNVADGNYDNVVIYNSNYNIVQNNQLKNARDSGVRINQNSQLDYILGNTITANVRSFLLYDGVNNIYIAHNTAITTANFLETKSNVSAVVLDSNHYGPGGIRLGGAINIFETNNIEDKPATNKNKL